MTIETRLIGNDESDVHCDVCGRSGWYQALEVTRDVDTDRPARRLLCLRRYEGQSCGELAKAALFQTNIPAGTFDPVVSAS